jgi:hypothetical protein
VETATIFTLSYNIKSCNHPEENNMSISQASNKRKFIREPKVQKAALEFALGNGSFRECSEVMGEYATQTFNVQVKLERAKRREKTGRLVDVIKCD